jgi:DNA-directed RNA polymerase subunit RPC12/RpoP
MGSTNNLLLKSEPIAAPADWNLDINDNGSLTGKCPHCGERVGSAQLIAPMVLRCEYCGHTARATS